MHRGCALLGVSSGWNFCLTGGCSQRGLGCGCGCWHPLPRPDRAFVAPGHWFRGGRGVLGGGGGFRGRHFHGLYSNSRAAVPSHGHCRQDGQVSEDRLSLHPGQMLCQDLLLPSLLMLLQFLLQVLEEPWGRKSRALSSAGGPWAQVNFGKLPGIPSRKSIRQALGRDGTPHPRIRSCQFQTEEAIDAHSVMSSRWPCG